MIMSMCSVLADTIVTRSADTIECSVSHIGDSIVTYRKPGENFDREINRNDVFKIKYDNGSEDIFSENSGTPAAESIARSSSTADLVDTDPDWSVLPPASKTYYIGDWYSENGVEGIVIWTTSDGRHGRLIHPRKINAEVFKRPKTLFTGPTDIAIGMNDRSNGYANWYRLKEFMAMNPQYTSDMFPLYQLVADLGDGWYIPAINELSYFNQLRESQVAYTGMHAKFNGKTVKWGKILNHVAKSHKGQSLDSPVSISSTEVYSSGGASRTFSALYGDPEEAQYILLKYQIDSDDHIKPLVRDKGFYPNYAFHLF